MSIQISCVIILATCSDEIQNQDETDVDCGGDTCNACRKFLVVYNLQTNKADK